MGQVVLLVKLCIPLISLLGIAEFLSLKKNISINFAIPITVCIVIFLLNVGGYANLLPQTATVIYIIGWILMSCTVVDVFKNRKFTKLLQSYIYIYIIIGSALVVLYAKDLTFSHPDEFNHWGIVVKELVTIDGFPDVRTIISYREYTLSTALFSYFFLNVTGYSESLIYITHGFMYILGLSFLWKNSEGKSFVLAFMSMASVLIVIWSIPSSFQSLLVEFAVAIFGAFLIILGIETIQNKEIDIEKAFKYTTPIAIAISFIKSSAYAYWATYMVVMISFLAKYKKQEIKSYNNKKKAKILRYSLSPVIALLLWNQNVSKLYANEKAYEETKFSLSPAKMIAEAKNKGGEKISEILRDLLRSLFNSQTAKLAIIFIFILFALAYINRKNKDYKYYKLFAVIGAASWFIYYIGYGLSLIFLFPKWEMEAHHTNLLAYDRYLSTATNVVVILCVYALISAYSRTEKKKLKPIYALTSIVLLIMTYIIGYPNAIFHRDYLGRKTLDEIAMLQTECVSIPREYERNDRLLCYTGDYVDDSSAFNNFYLTIELLNNNVANFSNTTIEGGELNDVKMRYFISQNDYIAVVKPDKKMFDILSAVEIYADYEDGRLYKITPMDDGGYTLIKVG